MRNFVVPGKMRYRFFLFVSLIMLLAGHVSAQVGNDAELARQYMSNGDYDKAIDIYKKIYSDNPNAYYKDYYSCLLATRDYKEAEKIAGKQIKKYPDVTTYYVDLGYAYSQEGDTGNMQKEYDLAIDNLKPQRAQIVQLANYFIYLEAVDYAVKTYEKGKKLLNDYTFNFELAGLYYHTGSFEKALDLYLDFLAESEANFDPVSNTLQRILDSDDKHHMLQQKLIERIQKSQHEVEYTELLIWDYMQLKDFADAFLQAKALDKRFREDGGRIYELGQTAENEADYDAAIQCYNYLIDKGVNYPYYFASRNGILNCRRDKIYLTNTYTPDDLDDLRNSYTQFLGEYGRKDSRAASVSDDLAKLLAFYIHDTHAAIAMLEDVIDWPTLSAQEKATYKLDLGDFYLMQGDVWTSTLMYSQVDKAMRDAPLGEEARFKNAKLAYYRGDFSYAQGQLDVLKAATSELVANDAMELSVFITENFGLDSLPDPMLLYAHADLYVFRNLPDSALMELDSLQQRFPGHALSDDMLWLRAQIALKQQKVQDAVQYLEDIRQHYAYDLLADDAIFKLGEIYQYSLNDPEKAKDCYEQLILNYKDSLYVTEARNRYRKLRGDSIN